MSDQNQQLQNCRIEVSTIEDEMVYMTINVEDQSSTIEFSLDKQQSMAFARAIIDAIMYIDLIEKDGE